ncbi:hypothetical protein TorRG33x02_057020 [Trema orientale]|uniref:Uncharacterized protein n=1 Tax=Trema orientale TaxID=63057 RepID=A0A2P5FKZ1_TREOI|nr:hypothetical protein TorRG33x02_057020 [Trema orientale]
MSHRQISLVSPLPGGIRTEAFRFENTKDRCNRLYNGTIVPTSRSSSYLQLYVWGPFGENTTRSFTVTRLLAWTLCLVLLGAALPCYSRLQSYY